MGRNMHRASLYITVAVLLMTFGTIDLAPVFSNPSPVTLNENDDSAVEWPISATCSPQNNIYDVNGTFTGTITIPGVTCSCTSNPTPNLFTWTGSAVRKAACSDTDCGDCLSCSRCLESNGCLPGPTSYSISVTCSTSGYDINDSGTTTLTVIVEAESPTLTISLPTSVSADNTMSVNRVLATASASSGPAIVEYSKSRAVSNTYLLTTANMFELNTANGEIYIATDPSLEYDYDYTMEVRIYSRRQSSSATITINFDGCFETPNCNNQSDTSSFSDEHGIGATLFNMTYNNPSAHFAAISSTWQNLNFVVVNSTLDVATLHLTTGVISTTGNITVWPDHPHATHSIVVQVSNPEHSCSYTSTCTMSFQVSFTNHPISFLNSLPTSTSIHEDTDSPTQLHRINTFDGNDPTQDNVTCEEVTNDNDTLLELHHDGNYSHDSWSIYKKNCSDPGCGYINDDFFCTSTGCLNYDDINQFTISINCKDAYDSETGATVFTLNVRENQAPIFTNTPTTITLNTDRLAHGDNVFSLFYTDAEDETLDYNFTITPSSPSLFAFDTRGNYYNDPANVTSTIFQWDLQNTSFTVNFCGRERRNINCSSFEIDIREYCGPTPACTDDHSVTVTDEFTVGEELFQIMVTGSGYTSLTYFIITEYTSLFTVNPNTGSVTTLEALSVKSPPDSTTYSIVGNVYDTAACDVAACSFSVTVTFTNYDITITNMPAGLSQDIHEDTSVAVTLITIATADNNTIDGVTCTVDETASTPANNGIFSAEETDTGSNVFELISQEGNVFDYSTTTTYIIVVECADNYGSTATASMTVSILENQVPTMDNLAAGDMINVDPMSVSPGYVIFTLQTSDDENDNLDFSWNITNSLSPLESLSDGVVSLRRNLRIPDEDGEVFGITLCIEDAVHNHTVCETLSVNFTSSKTNPVLDNLPANVSFAEDTSVGTTLFTVTKEDPDVDDVHTFSMTVYPKTSSSAFSLDANDGHLTLQSSLDYETLNYYEFLFSVKDQYLDGLQDKYLTLYITDVNEAPTLTLSETTFDTIEQSTGYEVATLQYTCTDVDRGQTMNVSVTSGTYMSYFSFDSTTGIITYAQDWDFENPVVPPQTTTLEITCDDGNGLSDSTNIVINISPKNEFAPVLSLYEVNATIYSNQTLLDALFVVTASDTDYGDDGVFEYSIVGTGQGSQYFTIRDINVGELFISNYINWKYNYTWEFTVKVTDGESEPLKSHVHVIVTYIAPDPVIPTKEKARCITCTSIGKGVVATLYVEAALILIFFTHCFCRMKFYRVCHLKAKPRLQTLADLDKMLKENQKAEDPYLHDTDMFKRALPSKKAPAAFSYEEPIRRQRQTLEPPEAAEYLPPGAIIDLAHFQGPTAHAHTRDTEEVSAEVYSNNMNTTPERANGLYNFTKHDQSAPSDSIPMERIGRIFKTPDKTHLYGANTTRTASYEFPEDSWDF